MRSPGKVQPCTAYAQCVQRFECLKGRIGADDRNATQQVLAPAEFREKLAVVITHKTRLNQNTSHHP